MKMNLLCLNIIAVIFLFIGLHARPAFSLMSAEEKRSQIVSAELDHYEKKKSFWDSRQAPAAPSKMFDTTLPNYEMAVYDPSSVRQENFSRTNIISKELDRIEASFSIETGMRMGKFQWDIAGDINGSNPNVLSELTWRDLKIYQLGGQAKMAIDDTYVMEAGYHYGWILNGRNQDSDYAGDFRTSEFSKSSADTNGDDYMDASVGLGYKFEIMTGEWKEFWMENARDTNLFFTVLGGYSYNELNLRDRNGFQIVPSASSGPFSNLNSTYQAKWTGPWTGFELAGRLNKVHSRVRFEYHWMNYDAGADWNLRSDFEHPVSFIHEAEGNGIKAAFGGNYDVTDNWQLGLDFGVERWWSEPGLDRTFFADGTRANTQLNSVTWNNYSVMLISNFLF